MSDLTKTTSEECVVLVFSRDRALQLDATLRSFIFHCQDTENFRIDVLCTASTPDHANRYAILQEELGIFSFIRFVPERDFRSDLLALLAPRRYVLFLVDDNIFVDDFSIAEAVGALEANPSAIGVSFRLGRNTAYCYPLDAPQRLPAFQQTGRLLKYDWTTAEHDFSYPLEVSSSLYLLDDMFELLAGLSFRNPNSMEAAMAARADMFSTVKPTLLCFERSVTFCAPVNKVQTELMENRAGSNAGHTIDSLGRLFDEGMRVWIASYDQFVPNACHQEVKLDLTSTLDMKGNPLVSVIIPCFNQAHFLTEAIGSVVAQTFTDWECIIVNDGSPDATSFVAEDLMARYPGKKIRLLNKANGGLADARNAGIRESRGRFILPLDADDKILPRMLERTVELLEQNPAVAIAYTDTLRFGASDIPYQTEEYDFGRLCSVNILNYCSLYRREAWEVVGGYNRNMVQGYEDWEFWISCGEKGFVGKRVPEFLFMYRIKEESMLTTALRHDDELKAQIVLNHPDLYVQDLKEWAARLLKRKSSSQTFPNVLLVTHNFPPRWYGGVEVYVSQFAETLEAAGCRVSVIYPVPDDSVSGMHISEIEHGQVRVHEFRFNPLLPQHAQLVSQITERGVEELFGEFLRQNNYDIVHVHHSLNFPLSIFPLTKMLGVPICATLHDFWLICPQIHLIESSSQSLCNGPETAEKCTRCFGARYLPGADGQQAAEVRKWIDLRQAFVRQILDEADIVASPSRYLAEIFQRYGFSTDNITIAPLGLAPVERTRSCGTVRPVTFAFLGSISALKNVAFLVDVFTSVPGEARLLIYGSGDAGIINHLTESARHDSRIEYRGAYRPGELPAIVAEIDLLVLPSRSENYPVVIREALSAGVPVLASKVGGIPEIVEHMVDGILFDVNSADELIGWLRAIIDDPSLLTGLRKRVRPVKTIEQDVEEWLGRYESFSKR